MYSDAGQTVLSEAEELASLMAFPSSRWTIGPGCNSSVLAGPFSKLIPLIEFGRGIFATNLRALLRKSTTGYFQTSNHG